MELAGDLLSAWLPPSIFMSKKDNQKTFLLTDGCMWEMNKQNGTEHPHAIEVVDMETGQVRYIKCGAQIRFVSGDISEGRDQKSYNAVQSDAK